MADKERILAALELPENLEEIKLDDLNTDECVEFAAYAEQELLRISELMKEILAPVRRLVQQAKDRVKDAIPEDGVEYPHPTFIVRKEQKTERDKRVDQFFALKGLIPDEDFDSIVSITSITGRIPPEVAKQANLVGADIHFGVDLRKADKIARHYGGKVKQIVEDASPRVDIGLPYLTIEPRESAVKRAG